MIKAKSAYKLSQPRQKTCKKIQKIKFEKIIDHNELKNRPRPVLEILKTKWFSKWLEFLRKRNVQGSNEHSEEQKKPKSSKI